MARLIRRYLYLFMLAALCMTLSGCGDTRPNPPSGLTAVAGNGKVTVSWSSGSATTYRLYYSTTSGATKGGTKIDPATSPREVTGLTNGTTYYFTVAAVNSDGESPLSNEVSATPANSATPAAPTGVTATSTAAGKATISWTAVTDATSYYVYYATTSADATKTKGTRSASTSAFTLDITGLTAGPRYFVVTAANSSGTEGEASATPVLATIL